MQDLERQLREIVVGVRFYKTAATDVATHLEKVADEIGKRTVANAGAKHQLRILADMLDDGLVEVSTERNEFVAREIRKFVEWIK
jgi:histone H3/H4